jgi:hypothetical protein
VNVNADVEYYHVTGYSVPRPPASDMAATSMSSEQHGCHIHAGTPGPDPGTAAQEIMNYVAE